MTVVDFTLSNARRFFSSMGNPSDMKALMNMIVTLVIWYKWHTNCGGLLVWGEGEGKLIQWGTPKKNKEPTSTTPIPRSFNVPFAAERPRGTKSPNWRAKDAFGYVKQRKRTLRGLVVQYPTKLIILKNSSLCWQHCPKRM